MGALNTYLTQVRRLTHDPNDQMWSATEKTDYINQARRRVAADTYCLRQLNTGVNLVAGTEKYVINSTVSAGFQGRVVAVVGIDLYWGQTRYPLYYAPWSMFSLNLRFWTQMQQRPSVFTRQGALSVYIGNTPDQAYVTDWDLAINPNDLVSDSTPDELVVPYTDIVQWWAAHLCMFDKQSFGEADAFEQKYTKERANAGTNFQKFVNQPLVFQQ